MVVDWNILTTISSPIITLLIGIALNHYLENRPKVISYLGHVSGIRLSSGQTPMQINTHSVVLRNAGRKTANQVRLGHNVLPDFQVNPDIAYSVETLPGGGKEIVFPQLIPKKQITVSYLYFPPLLWSQINTHIESEEGPVKIINVLPTAQLPKWLLILLWLLIGYGFIGVVYTVYVLFFSI